MKKAILGCGLVFILLGLVGIFAGPAALRNYFFPQKEPPPARQEVAITVIEGWTIEDIRRALSQLGADVRPSDYYAERYADEFSFLKDLSPQATLEGYLFPDTYRVWKDELPDALLRKQLQEFTIKTAGFDEIARGQGRTARDVLILASIVEKEVGRDEDRARVAGIFMNRLKAGMKLQSDATLNYVLRTGRSRLTLNELENESPYNSYKYAGLPPGPISNPGKASLDAALRPENTEYWYFLTDNKGKAYFGRNLEEHAANRGRAYEP